MNLDRSHLIPVEKGQAVSRMWTRATDFKPLGITWHWTATHDLKTATRILGGKNPLRKGKASAHFGLGKTKNEGIHQYVDLSNRSWHCGAGQSLEIDGRKLRSSSYKGSRVTIGIEVVHIGYARKGIPSKDDWISCLSQNGRQEMKIAPWPDEQIEMMIQLGKFIIEKYPHIKARHHHGHADLAPSRKIDVLGFPMARILRGIYEDDSIPDIWSPYWTAVARQKALIKAGYNLGSWGADGSWGRMSQGALEQFQQDNGLVVDGCWTQWVSAAIHKKIGE